MGKVRFRAAKFSILELTKKFNIKSYTTSYDTKRILLNCMTELHGMGYNLGNIKGLKAKHVYRLIDLWHEKNLSSGTIKNRLSILRKTFEVLDKPHQMKPDNKSYNIKNRTYVSSINKAIDKIDLSSSKNEHLNLSIEGQNLFGLRREESMKIIISEAHQDGYIELKPNWTKGGVGRIIPITNHEQIAWIGKVKKLVGNNASLIPEKLTYVNQLSRYKYLLTKLEVNNLHGLRHSYAQNRYKELTMELDPNKKGWECSLKGGLKRKVLSLEQKLIDMNVRTKISRELGHSRIEITSVYLGN